MPYGAFFCVAAISSFSSALAQTNLPKTLSAPDETAIQLTDEEIIRAFSDVRDNAEVQDVAKTRAVNSWYADGRFISRWNNGVDSGEVTGTWRVENDLRCVTISSGLPQRHGQESCGPVYRRGSKYLSVNSDGSIHGIHTLSPLP
ncbi:MAG: hypothetical protein AB8B81_08105 [Halioglobus sp.]